MEAVVNECARHLITELTPDSCIEIRSLPGISGNKTLIAALDSFINTNVSFSCSGGLNLNYLIDDSLISVRRSESNDWIPANAEHSDRGPLPDEARNVDCVAQFDRPARPRLDEAATVHGGADNG